MAISFPLTRHGADGRSAKEDLRQTSRSYALHADQDVGPHQEGQPTMSDHMTTDSPNEAAGLRILAKSGAQIDYRSERELIS